MKKSLQMAASAIAFSTALLMPITVNASGFGDLLMLVADGSGHGGGGHGGGSGGRGGGGHSSGGHESDSHSSDSHEGGSHSSGGQRGSGKGAGGQRGADGGASTRPNWAGQELADIGRLNVIKSPDFVLQQAIRNVEDYQPSIYSKSVPGFINSLKSLDQIIDSPVANVAILKQFWTDGTVALDGVKPKSDDDFAAILIGTAVEKGTKVTSDIVDALATIVGKDLTDKQTATIATAADDVREKVVEVHDAS
jgi:hypothetical protein